MNKQINRGRGGGSKEAYALFGPVPLSRGERLEDFEQLREAVADQWKPVDFADYLDVHEFTIKVWEIHRLRRAAAGVVDSHRSIVDLLEFIFPDNPEKARQVARNYLSTDVAKHTRAVASMAQHGISDREIEAHAIAHQAQVLRLIDQMISSRESARSRIVQQAERRKELARTVQTSGDVAVYPPQKEALLPGPRKRFALVDGKKVDR